VIAQIVWWTAIAAEAFIVVRSCNAKLYGKYPAFYLYVTISLFVDVLRFAVFIFHPSVDQQFSNVYEQFYWYSDLLAETFGYAVIIEIYNQGLKSAPGVVRVARTVLFGLLASVIVKTTGDALTSPTWSPATASAVLERNLYALQPLLLVVIIGLLLYYKVPIGRNLKGIAFGYSFYVAAKLICIAFGSLPKYALRPEWKFLDPMAYLVALLIWGCTLWSYQPNPEPQTESGIERDYTLIAEHTRRALSRARSFLKLGGEL
jgi:hypothetical protein